MQEKTFKLILKSKNYDISSNKITLGSISPNIYSELLSTKQYAIKSDVSDEIFQNFISFLEKKNIPLLTSENISQYEQLSAEFDSMQNLIQTFRKVNLKKSIDFHLFKNQDLNNQISNKITLKNEKISQYQQFMNYIFKNNGIDSLTSFNEHKDQIYKSVFLGNTKKVDLITHKQVKQGNLVYSLNEERKTAVLLYGISSVIKNNDIKIFIPRSIFYEDQEYLVTEIADEFLYDDIGYFSDIEFDENSELQIIGNKSLQCRNLTSITIPRHVKIIGKKAFFANVNLKTINFPDDSELETIEYLAFFKNKLESITIPSSVIELNDFWIAGTPNLKTVTLMPNNKRYKYYNNDFIIGKSDIKSDIYDVIVFVRRDIEKVVVPSFIRKIQSGAFDCCSKLKSIEVPKDSKLESIGKLAISELNIEKITILSDSVDFEEGWCRSTTKPIEFEITPSNKNILYVNNSFLLGKSNPKIDYYDILLFAQRDIVDVVIPSYIKRIASFAFERCKSIESIQFESNSQLLSIGTEAFARSSIKGIKLPSHVMRIEPFAFFLAEQMKYFDLPDDTELKEIDGALDNSSLQRISLPSDVSLCDFNCCFLFDFNHIKIIPRKTQKYMYYNDSFLLMKSDYKSDIFDILVFARKSIKVAHIPSFIKKIGAGAFSNCKSIKNVTFQDDSQLESIENSAFSCSSLKFISIPSTVSYIGPWCFFICQNLISVNLPINSKLKTIGMEMFSRSTIRYISIPASVTSIGHMAFKHCEKLQRIDIPNNSKMRYIGFAAFARSRITNFLIPSQVYKIGENAFYENYFLDIVEIAEDTELEELNKKELGFSDSDICCRNIFLLK